LQDPPPFSFSLLPKQRFVLFFLSIYCTRNLKQTLKQTKMKVKKPQKVTRFFAGLIAGNADQSGDRANKVQTDSIPLILLGQVRNSAVFNVADPLIPAKCGRIQPFDGNSVQTDSIPLILLDLGRNSAVFNIIGPAFSSGTNSTCSPTRWLSLNIFICRQNKQGL
jgi:hypothetical protein